MQSVLRGFDRPIEVAFWRRKQSARRLTPCDPEFRPDHECRQQRAMMRLTSVFVLDPPERLDPPTDTSLAVMRASARRGHRVFFTTLDGLLLEGERVRFKVRPAQFVSDGGLFSAGSATELKAAECDIVYMRKDPPFDVAYLHATLILDHLPRRVLQINPARALRIHCEKLIPLHFPGLLPPTVVTRDTEELAMFLTRTGRMVVKRLDDCSGRGIVAVSRTDPDRIGVLDRATDGGTRFVQGQQFLPEAVEGDKRVLMLGGEILGWIRRVPAPGDFRSNVNAGGHCIECDLSEGDRAICGRIGAWLRQQDIHLAGVDIVGSHVLEVNITSPSCLQEMNALTGQRLEERIVDYAEGRLSCLAARQNSQAGSS